MENDFAKDIDVAFEEGTQGFEDGLTATEIATLKQVDPTQSERSGDVRWYPEPYIAKSTSDEDQSENFGKPQTQLLVPTTINYRSVVVWELSANELRDAIQNKNLTDAAVQRHDSDINTSVLSVISYEGTLVLTKSTAASEYGDVSKIDALLNRTGVPAGNRKLALNSDDYNGMARDLANRGTLTEKSTKAYEESWVGRVAGLDTSKLDYGITIAAAAGGAGLTVSTLAGAGNFHVPKAKTAGDGGQLAPFDNRRQRITVSSTANVKRGDCFTIGGITELHHIQKGGTGKLKTYRVMIDPEDATHLVISPPIISNQGGSLAEEVYQNCSVAPSATAAIVFLNIAAASANPFLRRDAIWLQPARIAVRESGIVVRRATTHKGKGLEIVMTEQTGIGNLKTKFRSEVRWGVTCMKPEMCGIELFNQA